MGVTPNCILYKVVAEHLRGTYAGPGTKINDDATPAALFEGEDHNLRMLLMQAQDNVAEGVVLAGNMNAQGGIDYESPQILLLAITRQDFPKLKTEAHIKAAVAALKVRLMTLTDFTDGVEIANIETRLKATPTEMKCTQITYKIDVPGQRPVYTVMPTHNFTGVVTPAKWEKEGSKIAQLFRDAYLHKGDAVIMADHNEVARLDNTALLGLATPDQVDAAVSRMISHLKLQITR